MARSFLFLTFVLTFTVGAGEAFQLTIETAADQNLYLDREDNSPQHEADNSDTCCAAIVELTVPGSDASGPSANALPLPQPLYKAYSARAPPVLLS